MRFQSLRLAASCLCLVFAAGCDSQPVAKEAAAASETGSGQPLPAGAQAKASGAIGQAASSGQAEAACTPKGAALAAKAGIADDIEGVRLGMSLEDAKETLRCRRAGYQFRQFYKGDMYRSDKGTTVAVQAWVVDATFNAPDRAETIEMVATGDPDDLQVISISHEVSKGSTPETMPTVEKVMAEVESRYGPMPHGYILQTPDGDALDQNSPVGVLCQSATEPRCGRHLRIGLNKTYLNTVASYKLTMENGSIASPILAKAKPYQQQ